MRKDNKNYRILVIEDNAGDFMLIEDYLDEQIAEPVITNVKNFSAAKLLLETHGPDHYDVILLDLSLPDMDGETLITEMNVLCPVCPVIVLTGYADIAFSIRSLSMGIADYLLKEDITASSLYKSIVYNIERKKTNTELAASQKRYSNIFHLSPQPMWVYDRETLRFIQVNKAATEHYGYSEAEFLNMTLADISLPEDNIKQEIQIEKEKGEEKMTMKKAAHVKKSKELIDVETYSSPITLNDKVYNSVIAIDITEKLLMEQQVTDMKIEEQNKITKAVINAQEKERTEIGEELHDNVNQLLAASKLYLNHSLSRPDSSEFVLKSLEYIATAMDEIRKLSHALVGVTEEKNIGLCDSVEELIKSIRLIKDINVSFNYNFCEEDMIEEGLKQVIYRIIQEQFSNVLKYAEASEVEIDLKRAGADLVLCMTDNGKGFDTDAKRTGIGLKNITNRAAVYKGAVHILSSEGNGCKLEIIFPDANNIKALQTTGKSLKIISK